MNFLLVFKFWKNDSGLMDLNLCAVIFSAIHFFLVFTF